MWAAVSSFESFPQWAPWLRDFERDGPWPEAGTTATFDVVSPLPHRLSLAVQLTHVSPHEVIEARVLGDLNGTGRLSARDHPRGGTEVELTWSVEPKARILQTLVRISGPFVRWTQDWAVRVAVAGVKRKLNA